MTIQSTISATCWSCGAELTSTALLCPVCGKLQPASSADYFQVFGLDRKFFVDAAALGQEFHRLSRKLHPDRFARATADEQQWSLANTALLNDAYRSLRETLPRTEYLLKLEGISLGEENSGQSKPANRQPPADLLEEVFELNMQLEEMRMNKSMGEDDLSLQSDLTSARSRFEKLLVDVDDDLANQAATWDTSSAEVRQKVAVTMATLLDRRRYLSNLVRDVNEVLAA
jgi:molecular chaperone HscB